MSTRRAPYSTTGDGAARRDAAPGLGLSMLPPEQRSVNFIHFTTAVHFVKSFGYTSCVAKLERREREKAEFRDEVLAAARRIVLKEGFDALTMRKIAEAIDYAPGTIYLYFESRDAIAHELCHAGFEEFLAALRPAAAVVDPVERLRELGRRYVRFGLENPETYRLIFMEDPKYTTVAFREHEQAADSPGMQALSLLISIFSELRARERLASNAEPAALAETTWAMVHGIVSLKIAHAGTFPLTSSDELLELVTDSLILGLLKR
jgi:AcrR family transcriptional regulator